MCTRHARTHCDALEALPPERTRMHAAAVATVRLRRLACGTAGQYCEYDVTKINKHKTRERRVMGIDQDRIHNKLPTGPQTQAGLFGGFMKSMQAGKKTKKGYKEIRHVVEITHKAGTNVFVIK